MSGCRDFRLISGFRCSGRVVGRVESCRRVVRFGTSNCYRFFGVGFLGFSCGFGYSCIRSV